MKEFCRKPETVTRNLRVLNVKLPFVFRHSSASNDKTPNTLSGVIAG